MITLLLGAPGSPAPQWLLNFSFCVFVIVILGLVVFIPWKQFIFDFGGPEVANFLTSLGSHPYSDEPAVVARPGRGFGHWEFYSNSNHMVGYLYMGDGVTCRLFFRGGQVDFVPVEMKRLNCMLNGKGPVGSISFSGMTVFDSVIEVVWHEARFQIRNGGFLGYEVIGPSGSCRYGLKFSFPLSMKLCGAEGIEPLVRCVIMCAPNLFGK
jgi:hypothetical protein